MASRSARCCATCKLLSLVETLERRSTRGIKLCLLLGSLCIPFLDFHSTPPHNSSILYIPLSLSVAFRTPLESLQTLKLVKVRRWHSLCHRSCCCMANSMEMAKECSATSADPVSTVDLDDSGGHCGWCCWRPKILQRFSTSKSFLFWICWAGGFQSRLFQLAYNLNV